MANVDVEVWLHKRSKLQRTEEQAEESATDQLLPAAEHVCRRYRARHQQSFWPSARMDTERARWVDTLAAHLVLTPTPVEKVAGSATRQHAAGWWRKADFNHLFSGKGVTLLPEVVFSISYHLGFPKETIHHTECSRTHHSDQCNRGALKKTHPACAFLEKAGGVPEAEKHAPQLSTT